MVLKINRFLNSITLTMIMLVSVVPFKPAFAAIPVTADPLPNTASAAALAPKSSVMALTDFASALKDGSTDIRGVYVPDVMAFRVVQQPKNQNGYVSGLQGVVTQFKMASDYGTIGLLAHNFAAGTEFSKIAVGNLVSVIYGNGTQKTFKVSKILQYQALQPNSTSSNFLDLSTNQKLSASALFKLMYAGTAHLTLQTCIAKDNIGSWGRLFVIAEPVQ